MPKQKTYQVLVNGKPFGSVVLGYQSALFRRRCCLCASCDNVSFRRGNLCIVDTPAVAQCASCPRFCSARLREVRP